MAWALKFDGANDYLPVTTITIPASIPFEIEFRLSFGADYARVFGTSISPSRSRCLIFYSTQTVRFTDSVGVSAEFTAPTYTKTDKNTFKLVRDASNNADFYLNDVLVGTVSSFSGAFSINQIGKNSTSFYTAASELEYLNFTINGVNGPFYDATVSSHAAGTPVLTDTATGNDASGVNFPTDGSAWVDLGGGTGITLTATLGTINYTSQNTAVGLTGSVDVISTLGSINYTSQNSTVTLSGLIDISATLGTITYNSYNVTVGVGEGQLINNITGYFADDIYSSGFKSNIITVNFK